MKKKYAFLLALLLLLLSIVTVWAESWKATSVGPPEGRSGHTAVWTGSRMIVWGGFHGSDLLHTGGQYNPGNGAWTPTATAGGPRRGMGTRPFGPVAR